MSLSHLPIATLALLVVVGCSTRGEKSSAPTVGTLPQRDEDREPIPLVGSAAEPRPAEASAASLQPSFPVPPSQEPTTPPDPYAGISADLVPLYQQLAETLEPLTKQVRAGLQAAYQPRLSEGERQMLTGVLMSRYKLSLNQDAERRLRLVLAKANDAETKAGEYLDAVGRMWSDGAARQTLAAAYQQALDQGVEIPAETRRLLGDFRRRSGGGGEQAGLFGGGRGAIAKATEGLRTELLEMSVEANDLFHVAVRVHKTGQSVVAKRQWTQTFHHLVVALPEPHRGRVLTQLAWPPEQEAALEEKRRALKERNLPPPAMLGPGESARWERRLKTIAAQRRDALLALEQARHDTIEGYFHDVDVRGWQALVALDGLVAELQAVIEAALPDFSYRFPPLLPAGASREAEADVLARVPLPGSARDRVPTVEVRRGVITFDAPAGHLGYAEILKPGNVLVGTCRLREEKAPYEQRETTYRLELRIRASEHQVVRGELVMEAPGEPAQSLPFQGEIGPSGFTFEAPPHEGPEIVFSQGTTFTGELDQDGALTGSVSGRNFTVGTFSLMLR